MQLCLLDIRTIDACQGGYGATVARVTPDHKVGSSNLSGLIHVLEDMWWRDCKVAASEDRTHDLRIMRPTRCQLRYRRSYGLARSVYWPTRLDAIIENDVHTESSNGAMAQR